MACGSCAAPDHEASVVGGLDQWGKDLDEKLHVLVAALAFGDLLLGGRVHGEPSSATADARDERIGLVLGFERAVSKAKLDIGGFELGARVRVVAVV